MVLGSTVENMTIEEAVCKVFLNGVDLRELGRNQQFLYYIISRYDDDIWWSIQPMHGLGKEQYNLLLDCRLYKGDFNIWKGNPYSYQATLDSVMVVFTDYYNPRSENYSEVKIFDNFIV